MPTALGTPRSRRKPGGLGARLPKILLGLAAFFYLLHFLHLRADFPNNSPWSDWSKMTDEGWYASAAIHHILLNHWYLPDSFNPAVAMPVWPILLGLWFKLTGVGIAAARSLTLLVYLASLTLFYVLLRRHRPGLMPALAVALLCINPFCYAFQRMALLEPVLVLWLLAGILLASHTTLRDIPRQIALGLILCLLVLTKTTGLFLAPAILYHLAATLGGPWRTLRRPLAITAGSALVFWLAYFLTAVVPHHLADYRLLFTINPDRVHLGILPLMTYTVLADGLWLSRALFSLALLTVLLSTFWLRELWRIPLFGSFVVATAGYLAFIVYHTNFQPRYYLVVAMPVTAVVLMGIDALWQRKVDGVAGIMATILTIAAIAMMVRTTRFILKPDYTLSDTSQSIAEILRADHTANPVLLSNTGDDITLFTGIPALCDQYTPHGTKALLDRYHPGWAALWEGQEDPNAARLAKFYHLVPTARYKVFDDPTRAVLILYRLENQ